MTAKFGKGPRPGAKGPGQKTEANKTDDNKGRSNRDSFNNYGGRNNEKDNDWQERVVQIRRVTKVVKGGKNMSFSALVVIGDTKGNLGVGLGKAAEVVDAIRKAVESAKKNLIRVPFDQGSVPHAVVGHFGSTKVHLFRAPKGTGLIACWSIKMALEAAGLHNLVCKTIGSTNPINVLYALIDAIGKLKTKSQIRQLRGGSSQAQVEVAA
jgi:small subunit ribosomal protein S5